MNIVILTGAGISAESGVPTFRDNNGLWEQHKVEDVATPEAFYTNPELVYRFYNMRRDALNGIVPNAAHYALAKLEEEWTESIQGEFTLITQNIDGLHPAAGSKEYIPMHGELKDNLCGLCGTVSPHTGHLSADDACPHCGRKGTLRPNIVWFGEMPYFMENIYDAVSRAHVFVSIGTSGNVYPAAGLVDAARNNNNNCNCIEINIASTGNPLFHRVIEEPATIGVPRLIKDFLGNF